MGVHHNQIFMPSTLTELFSTWARFPNAVPFAGGTSFSSFKTSTLMELPGNVISIERIRELHKITRTERYLEIGSMVKLNDLIRIGKIIPAILQNTIMRIANPPLRNLAAIGGSICYAKQKLDIHAPLAALDASYELKTAASSRWIAASRFNIKDDPTSALNAQELLTRIRIPLESWDYATFKKFERGHFDDSEKGVIVFIAKAQKDIISDVRIVFAGVSLIMNRNLETMLFGQRLPLDRKTAAAFVGLWENYLNELPYPNGLLAAKILNFIRSVIQDLTR